MGNILKIEPKPDAFLNRLGRLEAFNRLSELEHCLLRGEDVNFGEYFDLYELLFENKAKESNKVVLHPAMEKQNQLRSLKVQKLKLLVDKLKESEKAEQDFNILSDLDAQLNLLDIKVAHFTRKWGKK